MDCTDFSTDPQTHEPHIELAGAAPLFIGLLTAARVAMVRPGALACMLQRHWCALIELEALAAHDDQALDLCGRLLGLVLDADNGRDLHALVRLRRGLRLATAFLQLRRRGRVQLVARLKAGDPDLRLEQEGAWIDLDLRPRRQAARAGQARYQVRVATSERLGTAGRAHAEPEIAVEAITFGLRPASPGWAQSA